MLRAAVWDLTAAVWALLASGGDDGGADDGSISVESANTHLVAEAREVLAEVRAAAEGLWSAWVDLARFNVPTVVDRVDRLLSPGTWLPADCRQRCLSVPVFVFAARARHCAITSRACLPRFNTPMDNAFPASPTLPQELRCRARQPRRCRGSSTHDF